MVHSRARYILISIILLCISYSSYAARLVLGSDTTGSQSFTTPVQQHILDTQGTFFVGAHEASVGNAFALASATQATNFKALAPATIMVDGVANSVNPLNGAAFTSLKLLSQYTFPIAVTSAQPANVYVFNTQLSNIISATAINDAHGAQTAGIIAIATGVTGNNGAASYIMPIVEPHGGSFGSAGSGIGLIKYVGAQSPMLQTLDATTGTTGNQATPFDGTISAIKIGDSVTLVPNVVDATFDNVVQRLYAVVELTAGASASDGGRALVMGQVINDTLTLLPIAPDAVFAGANNCIVGGTGSSAQISLYKVRTLQTSSRLSYVVVAGGNGSPTTTGNQIYALPLTNLTPTEGDDAILDPNQGTLANVNATPTDSFFTTPPLLKSRGIVTAAASPTDVFTTSSQQAIVGAGPLPLSASQQISDMIAMNDAVYVSISGTQTTTTSPGIFCSQAILDNYGRIKAWTPWQRAAGTQQPIFGFAVDPFIDTVWMITGTSVDNLTTVSLTQWYQGAEDGMLGGTVTDASVGLVNQVAVQLDPSVYGGIHNIFTFTQGTPSFGQQPSTVNNQLSLLVATSFGKVMLVETGRNASANIFTPNTGDFATGTQQFTDGTLTGFVNNSTTKILAISGGVLTSIGSIMAAEVSRTPLSGASTNGYLFVGGTNGLAVLAKNDLTGWDTSSPNGGLHAAFGSLTSTMSFHSLGMYTQVRKLWSDANYLYVLTNYTLDRITLSSIASGSPQIITLVTIPALNLPFYASFSDFGVSNKFGVLATSAGLYRVGNGKDITSSTISGPSDLDWTNVAIPEGIGPVSRLLFVSPTGDEGGFAYNGMIYVLSGVVTYNQAQVNRFFVSDVRGTSINNNTILPLNDLFMQGINSFLVEFGSYKNFIATDGIVLFNSRSGMQSFGPMLLGYSSYKTGFKYVTALNNFLALQLPAPVTTPNSSTISGIRHLLRNISGTWLASGSFGLYVNE